MTRLEELEREVELLKEIITLKEKLLEVQPPKYPPYPLYQQPYIGDPPPYGPNFWYSSKQHIPIGNNGYGVCTVSTTDHTIPFNKEGYPG